MKDVQEVKQSGQVVPDAHVDNVDKRGELGLKVKTDMLTSHGGKTYEKVVSVLEGTGSTEREDIKQHVRMLLLKRGITLDRITSKLSGMLEEEHGVAKYRDKLELLQYLNELHGVKTRANQVDDVNNTSRTLIMVNNMPREQLIGLLGDINAKTQEYIEKMKERQQSQEQEKEEA